jgi:hypothetical protein
MEQHEQKTWVLKMVWQAVWLSEDAKEMVWGMAPRLYAASLPRKLDFIIWEPLKISSSAKKMSCCMCMFIGKGGATG